MSFGFPGLMASDGGAFRQALKGAVFSFTSRPEPLAGDLRMSWGIGILLLSLFYSRGKRGSFQKVQFLAHAVRIREGREDVVAMLNGELSTSDVSVRIEPWLNRAVNYAFALRLLEVSQGKSVVLSEKGRVLAEEISLNQSIFEEEREFLRYVAPKMTEKVITKIWNMETLR